MIVIRWYLVDGDVQEVVFKWYCLSGGVHLVVVFKRWCSNGVV